MRCFNVLLIVILALLLGSCKLFPEPTTLAKIKAKGELHVITRLGPTTYYDDAEGQPIGFEYELVERFAKHLGVKLKMAAPTYFSDIIPMIERGDADLAAAGLTITEQRKQQVQFGPAYQEITQQLVYRLGNVKPKSIVDILTGDLEVVGGSSHVEQLELLKLDHTALRWRESHELESEDLLTFVWEEMIDYTVADSNQVAVTQRFYPELRVGFNLSEPQQLGWAFPKGLDKSLYNEAIAFFDELKTSGELNELLERYYGHTDTFDYVGVRKFNTHYYQRLSKYKSDFIDAAEKYDVDWRLVAAMGYQESHWNPAAVSPTGVRGIMMLTRNTARQLGVKNRVDAKQSIYGGAKYIKSLMKRIPKQIKEPDRTWMAVAAYNVGLGHLEDARVITERRGYNPDKWVYVKDSLPLLRKKSWYKKTRYGYARGHEPVIYVRNIRN